MHTPLGQILAPPGQTSAPAAHHARTDEPAVRLLDEILADAVEQNASDLHVEPTEQAWRIRLRVDGVLRETPQPPAHLRDALVTRIKVLARLDIAERRVPQDGRLRIAVGRERVEAYRVSTLPTLFGEKLVLRRLDAMPAQLPLTSLGLDAAQHAALAAAVRAPHGMILVTGPTGSGKTVSLCCLLQMLDRTALNVCTVEDPVEIQLPGVNQVAVRDKAGLTFATVLRALLRQDPDVLMVGEIRDRETADVALRAAQTGHLVLSTLHTNDAPSTLARLLDIGVAPFSVAAAVRLITAQRLLRKLCHACRQPVLLTAATLAAAGLSKLTPDASWQPYRPVGCPHCHGTGFRGRVGIHQVMPVSAALRELIVARADTQALARQAAREQVRTLRDAALAKVGAGLTSLEEALAATGQDE